MGAALQLHPSPVAGEMHLLPYRRTGWWVPCLTLQGNRAIEGQLFCSTLTVGDMRVSTSDWHRMALTVEWRETAQLSAAQSGVNRLLLLKAFAPILGNDLERPLQCKQAFAPHSQLEECSLVAQAYSSADAGVLPFVAVLY
eukprot:859562-Pelagomonas_calceolata.AAC.4